MGLNVVDPNEFKDLKVKEISCKTAMSLSGLEADYAVNPYRGCSHGCLYCYAPFVINESREWGTFVDVKRNIPTVLAKELRLKQSGTVRLGSVTDPYQRVEQRYQLTRMCLEQLKKAGVHVIIQTKSDLVVRDIEIFEGMDIDVGMTVTSLDEDFRKIFEPGAPSLSNRLDALEKLNDAGVNTWAFIGPLLPNENDDMDGLEELADRLKAAGVSEIYLDKLNMREGIWDRLEGCMDADKIARYRKIFSPGNDYFRRRKKGYEQIGKTVF